MIKEQGYIEKFSEDKLKKYDLNSRDIEIIKYLISKAINEKLYTDTPDYQHNLKHIEKVIAYTRMILKKMNNISINEELLMYAALYHDIGKTQGASNKEHGIVGAALFKKMMSEKMNPKQIEIISLLIYQHAEEEDIINFEESNYSKEEQESIQLMSNILKDADALDRNRLNQPAPLGTCDIKKLRTEEAKEILKITNSFYHDYFETIIDMKEKQTGKQIVGNYNKLEEWIEEFEQGKFNLFHASLDPSIEELKPNESTQKGSYVYAGINPVNCVTMASFRFSAIFPRVSGNDKVKDKNGKLISTIKELFPRTVEETLNSKYVTIYKMPEEKFREYINPVTSAPNGEWVSSEMVEPIEQISFDALELINYLRKNEKMAIVQDYSDKSILINYIDCLEQYIWGVKELKENPDIMKLKWEGFKKIVTYYSGDMFLKILEPIKNEIDKMITSYIEGFKNKNGREPDYDNEIELLKPLKDMFKEKSKEYKKEALEIYDSMNKEEPKII